MQIWRPHPRPSVKQLYGSGTYNLYFNRFLGKSDAYSNLRTPALCQTDSQQGRTQAYCVKWKRCWVGQTLHKKSADRSHLTVSLVAGTVTGTEWVLDKYLLNEWMCYSHLLITVSLQEPGYNPLSSASFLFTYSSPLEMHLDSERWIQAKHRPICNWQNNMKKSELLLLKSSKSLLEKEKKWTFVDYRWGK